MGGGRSRWDRITRQIAREGRCCHRFDARRIGAGLARRVCSGCGAVSVAEAPRACWATTNAGHQCKAWARRDSPTPLCSVHDPGDVSWIRALRRSCTVAFLHSAMGIGTTGKAGELGAVTSTDTARRERQVPALVTPTFAVGVS
jgi:hypothetical protein